ncbi:MAG: hypothetical protein JST84_05880 [Acidobacteria bacterium]|nr:hypothetical protein [Acidobacteriota bacterium]
MLNKVTDAATSFLIGGSEVLHATNKPQLRVPTEKKTRPTWTSGQFDYAAIPSDSAVKVLNAWLYAPGDTVKFAWEGTVANYFPTGSAGSTPFIIIQAPFVLPDMTRARGANVVVPIDFSNSQGFNLLSVPGITPTANRLS